LSSFADVFGDDDLRELTFFGINDNSVMGAVYFSVPGAPCWVGLPMMPPFMEDRARTDRRVNFVAGGIQVPYSEYGGEQIVKGDSMPDVVAVRTS
jgi:hypothetical protein